MRILGATRTSQQSLGRIDAGSVAAAAGSSSGVGQAAALAREAGPAMGQLAQSMAKVADIKADRQYQQSNLFMQKSDAEFWETIGGREFLDVDEIPVPFRTEGMESKGRVLSAEVIPQMYEAHVKSQLGQAAKIIDNKKLRADWEVRAQDTAVKRQSRIQTEANGAIESQIFKDQIMNFENAMDNDRADIALQITTDMKGPPELVDKLRDTARKGFETNGYEHLMIAGDERGMAAAVEFLRSDWDEYRGGEDGADPSTGEGTTKSGSPGKGQLDLGEREAWARKLERELARLGQGRGAMDKSQLALLKRQLRITEANSLKGKMTDETELVDLLTRAVAANDGSLSDDIEDLKMSITFTGLVNNMTLNDGPDRRAFLEQVDELQIPDYEKDQLMLRLEQANDAFTTGIRTDMMQTAADAGFVDLSPVSVESDLTQSGNVGTLVDQLSQRLESYHIAEANYGDGQGPLTKEEASALSTQLGNLSAMGKQGFLHATATTMGEDANQFFQQLSFNGASKSLAVAGMATLNGQASVSEAILRGGEYKSENPEEVKNLTKLLDMKIEQEMGTAYRNNPAYRSSLKAAIVDGYIGMALTAGEDLTSVKDGSWFSSGTFTGAVQGVTGGLVKQNGEMIAPPAYGTTQREWNKWVNTIAPGYIDTLGEVDGLDSRAVIDEIREGDILIRDTGKMGEYILTTKEGVPVRNALTGMAFVLPYDPMAERESVFRGRGSSGRTLTPSPEAVAAQKERIAARKKRISDEKVEQLRVYRLRQELQQSGD